MFIDLLKAWREQDFSSKIVEEFLTMLSSSEEMISYVFKVLTCEIEENQSQEEIYKKDQSINFTEREIRKKILVHLSAESSVNLSACLALISVSKDAERLGDYVKNIFELKKLLKGNRCNKELFNLIFDSYGKQLIDLFGKVNEAFRNSDKELANETIILGRDIAKRCEETIEKIVETDYNMREGVVIALGARYLKRIALHLSNIASSVVNPLTELDYLGRKEQE
jgi:phosphate transport system protein